MNRSGRTCAAAVRYVLLPVAAWDERLPERDGVHLTRPAQNSACRDRQALVEYVGHFQEE
jgi:hypothetical protein